MKILLHVALFFATFCSVDARELYHTRCEWKIDPNKQTEMQREVRSYMNAVIFPKVTLPGISFPAAVSWVQDRIPNHAPASVPTDRRGISIFLKQRKGGAEVVHVSLRSATLPQVLDAICAQHGYVWCVEPSILSIIPREEIFPQRDFHRAYSGGVTTK